MSKRKHEQKRAPIVAFGDAKRAGRYAARLAALEPGRQFCVLDHPRLSGFYTLGIMTAGRPSAYVPAKYAMGDGGVPVL